MRNELGRNKQGRCASSSEAGRAIGGRACSRRACSRRADAIAEDVSAHRPEDLPYLRAQAGGLMGYSVAALPTRPSLMIRNPDYVWAVRARLLLPLFNPGDRDALPASDERLCRGCTKSLAPSSCGTLGSP